MSENSNSENTEPLNVESISPQDMCPIHNRPRGECPTYNHNSLLSDVIRELNIEVKE